MNSQVTVKALRVTQKIGSFFIASMRAFDLVSISYSDVRRLAKEQRDLEMYLGIQRPISQKRIREIKEYLDGADATFPTGVILAVDEKCASFEEKDGSYGELTLRPFEPAADVDEEPIPFEKVAKVIDGQHRIAAFMDSNRNWEYDDKSSPFDMNIVVFVGADISEQANIFATVNLAQTKVNRSLVYDLTDLARSRSPYKTCHNVAVALDAEPESPLYRRIKRLGTATPGRKKEPLTQAGFVESLVRFISAKPSQDRNDLLAGKSLPIADSGELVRTPFRNLFIENRETDIAEILFNYFSAVRERWPESWGSIERAGNLLPRSNSFKALMVYLREDVYPGVTEGRFGEIPTAEDFAPYFSDVKLSDHEFTRRNFAPGSGGQSTFLKLLRGQIDAESLFVP